MRKHLDAANGDCCTFLSLMIPEIEATFQEISARAEARNDRRYRTGLIMRPYKHAGDFREVVGYGGWTEFWDYQHISTYPLLLQARDDACSKKEEKLSVYRTVLEQGRYLGHRDFQGIQSDLTPNLLLSGSFVVFGARAVGAKMSTEVLTRTPTVVTPHPWHIVPVRSRAPTHFLAP